MKSYGVTIQMKPLWQYFHMVLFVQYVGTSILSLWMKSYGVTIQMKPLWQYFHMVLFVQYVGTSILSLWMKSYGVTMHGTTFSKEFTK